MVALVGHIPHAVQAVVASLADVKVLSLWNGASNDLPPTNWDQPWFDDSAWPTATSPNFAAQPAFADPQSSADYDITFNGYGPLTRPYGFAPWFTRPAGAAQFIFRWRFTAPDDSWRFFVMDPPTGHFGPRFVSTYDSTGSFGAGPYSINGQVEASSGFYYPSSWKGIEDSGIVTPGASNLVCGGSAGYIDSFNNSVYWLYARVVFYQPYSVAVGTPWAFGTVTAGVNDKGVMGTGDNSSHLTPVQIDMANMPIPHNVVKVVTNGKTSLFLTTDGKIFGCGDNSTGMLGLGSTDSSVHATPVRIGPGLAPVIDVAIGGDCALALDRWGQVYGWGLNASGSLGQGNTSAYNGVSELTEVPSGPRAYALGIACGKNFSVIAHWSMSGSNVFSSSGDNTYGQLGRGTSGAAVTNGYSSIVNVPSGGAGVYTAQISAGDDQLLFLRSDGALYGCGRADYGSLGLYNSGVGTNRIINVLTSIGSSIEQAEQVGTLAFLLSNITGFTGVMGDGTPYGGAGDAGYNNFSDRYGESPTVQVYGRRLVSLFEGQLLRASLANFAPLDGFATGAGGSNNPSGPTGIAACATGSAGATVIGTGVTLATVALGGLSSPTSVNLTGTAAVAGGGPHASSDYPVTVEFRNAGGFYLDSGSAFAPVGGSVFIENIPIPAGAASMVVSAGSNFGNTTDTMAASWSIYCGSNRPNESKTVFAAYGFHPGWTFAHPTDSDGLLYTWGWGGAGQMGSGADPIYNPAPVAISGLQDVVGAVVTAGIVFAISTAVVALPRTARRFAAIFG